MTRAFTPLLLLLGACLALASPLIKPKTAPPPKPVLYVDPYLSKSEKYTYSPVQVWFNNRRAWCFPIDDNNRGVWPSQTGSSKSAQINTVLFPFYKSGESAGYPIFQMLPTDEWYTDSVLYMKVVVPDGYSKNKIMSYTKLLRLSGASFYPSGYYNLPVVPKNSKFQDASLPVPRVMKKMLPKQGWYFNQQIYYMNLGPIPTDPAAGTIVTGNFYRIQDKNGTAVGLPVIDAAPDISSNYTGFFAVKNFTTNEAANFYRSDGLIKGSPGIVDPVKILNCPVAFVEDTAFTSTPPGPPPPIMYNLGPDHHWVGGSNLYTYGPGNQYTTKTVFWQGQNVLCWNFGTNSAPYVDNSGNKTTDQSALLVNTVLFPIYKTPNKDGTPNPAGFPVFNGIPTDGRYSDAVEGRFVTLDDSTKFNQYTDYSSLAAKILGDVAGLYNYAIVPYGSSLTTPASYATAKIQVSVPTLMKAWFNGQLINYFDNGAIPQNNGVGGVPTSTAIVNNYGKTVLADVLTTGDAGYTGFYSLGSSLSQLTYENALDFPAGDVQYNLGILNCPTAAFL
ncbi:hypothetical protein DFJ73DRAFT_820938 [Zopfochytrium polystomum]|nr:hypothetical protein DFJ73DRAFT_820938 [Zopfochytrium polystomum]